MAVLTPADGGATARCQHDVEERRVRRITNGCTVDDIYGSNGQVLRGYDGTSQSWTASEIGAGGLGWPRIARGNAVEQEPGTNLPRTFPVIDRWADGATAPKVLAAPFGRCGRASLAGEGCPPCSGHLRVAADGIATSIRSLDLEAATYQNPSALASRINGYVDKVASFDGATLGESQVPASRIVGRQVVLAVREGAMSAAQRSVITAAAARAESMGVTLIVVAMR